METFEGREVQASRFELYDGVVIERGRKCNYVAVPARKKDIVYLDKEVYRKLTPEVQELVKTIFIPTETYTGPDSYGAVTRFKPQGRSSEKLVNPVSFRLGKYDYRLRVHSVKGCGGPMIKDERKSVMYSSGWGGVRLSRALYGKSMWQEMKGKVYCEPIVSIVRIPPKYVRGINIDVVNMHRLFDSNVRDITWQIWNGVVGLIKDDSLIQRRREQDNDFEKFVRAKGYSFGSTLEQNRTYLGMFLDIMDYLPDQRIVDSMGKSLSEEVKRGTLGLQKEIQKAAY